MLTAEQIAATRKLLNVGADVADDALGGLMFEALTKNATDIAGHTTTLSRVQTENTTLKNQVAELAKGKSPEIDADAIEEAADSRTEKLSRLAEKGKLTPAALKKAQALLLGEAGKRPALCLSLKAASHAGLASPIADMVIEILDANDPAELAKLQGERSRGQTVVLSRQTPGNTAPDSWVKEELAIANADRK